MGRLAAAGERRAQRARRRPAQPGGTSLVGAAELAGRIVTDIQGRCPACGSASLFLGEGGHVTCSRIDCPNPGAVDDLLQGGEVALTASLGGGRTVALIAHTLNFHGHTLADVRRMTDEQLLAVPGIGDTSLARIREAIPAPTPQLVEPVNAALGALEALARKIPNIIAEAMHQDRYTLAPPATDRRSRIATAVRGVLHEDLPGDMAEHVTEAVLGAIEESPNA
ncbi:DUF6085 family protein [Streptomyces sp. NBC_00338]|uniref:DUF6085 family protein n=1 Tax=Streptomyces sp. NBC_00338 TaxID=2975715 RepID=UPI00224DFCBF|nr:DUF6085 family protein [Streptomyces sp. NBC_00338]MCX5144633.1 DUF6085 family protein [Streptomyces sp. NBC_00338]MCX5145071.1 DUF6085 family protein [Streptomyces sp. NBC_00338]